MLNNVKLTFFIILVPLLIKEGLGEVNHQGYEKF